MPALLTVVMCLLLSYGSAAAQPASKQVYPKKSGIYAMTPQGAVELKVSGERNDIEHTNGVKCFYSAESFDRIPTAESVQSFHVSAMDWAPRGIYLVVGRDALINSLDCYQRFAGSVVSRGLWPLKSCRPTFSRPASSSGPFASLHAPGCPTRRSKPTSCSN